MKRAHVFVALLLTMATVAVILAAGVVLSNRPHSAQGWDRTPVCPPGDTCKAADGLRFPRICRTADQDGCVPVGSVLFDKPNYVCYRAGDSAWILQGRGTPGINGQQICQLRASGPK
jgi:hypothetical protein